MSKLYIVPTPVGNMEDMTFRAIRILKEVDLILAEDTRTSATLMKKFEINTPMKSHHKFNEHETSERIAQQILDGQSVALISDAGTPAISDPGFMLVRECVKIGVEVECLPGATAFVPALVDSAFGCESFVFAGFMPQKKGRQKKLNHYKDINLTTIFYESPYRIIKLLEEIGEIFGQDRRISVSREISKVYEQTLRGNSTELIAHFKANPPKGEFVVVVDKQGKEEEENTEE